MFFFFGRPNRRSLAPTAFTRATEDTLFIAEGTHVPYRLHVCCRSWLPLIYCIRTHRAYRSNPHGCLALSRQGLVLFLCDCFSRLSLSS